MFTAYLNIILHDIFIYLGLSLLEKELKCNRVRCAWFENPNMFMNDVAGSVVLFEQSSVKFKTSCPGKKKQNAQRKNIKFKNEVLLLSKFCELK